MEILEIIAIMTVLSTLVYATILFLERWTDKAKLSIGGAKLEDLGDDKYNISVMVINKGRREAPNCRGTLTAFDLSGKKVELTAPSPAFRLEENFPACVHMLWVPIEVSMTKTVRGKIGKDKLEIQIPGKTIIEHIRCTLTPGDWNMLRLALPGFDYISPFKGIEKGKYVLTIDVFSGVSTASKSFKVHFPDDFKEEITIR